MQCAWFRAPECKERIIKPLFGWQVWDPWVQATLSTLREPFPGRWCCFCCSNREAKRACPGSWGEGGRQRTWLLRAEGKGLRFWSRLRGALEAYTRRLGGGGRLEPQVWAIGSNSSQAPWASLLRKDSEHALSTRVWGADHSRSSQRTRSLQSPVYLKRVYKFCIPLHC